MSYITTRDNVRLYFKDWGKGRPVVMMHGWPLSSATFDDLSMALADAGLRAISYDRRGFGRSQQAWDGYDYDTLSDDLAAVLEQTGARDATLLGFSMGGGEVARYMSRHGAANVKQAILVASIVPYMLKTADNPKGTDKPVFDQAGRPSRPTAPSSGPRSSRISTASAPARSRSATKCSSGRATCRCTPASRPRSPAPVRLPPPTFVPTSRPSPCRR